MRIHALRLLIALPFLLSVDLAADNRALTLPIGDEQRSRHNVAVTLDAIVDAQTGDVLNPSQLAQRIAAARVLFIGEDHTSADFHAAQLRVIEALHLAGREVLIGLEMYPYTQQALLDGWIAGWYTEPGFVEQSAWYSHWGYHWGYYRDIFNYAREHGLGMYAVNAPREVVSKVRKEGFDALDEAEAVHIPRTVNTESDDHRTLFRAYFESDDEIHAALTDAQWDGMFRAQCTWDATMAHNSIRALEEHGGPDSIMVVLIGAGHVAYGLGIQRQAALSFDGEMRSLIPVPVRDADGTQNPNAQASYADFVWGLPAVRDARYPSLGLATIVRRSDGLRQVIDVPVESLAARAGFENGDVLTGLDGKSVQGKGALNRQMAGLRWGDSALFQVRRGDELRDITVQFRRIPME